MLTLSSKKGIGGTIKSQPEDFAVREITGNGTTLREGVVYGPEAIGDAEKPAGRFTTFVLQKRNWDTIKALVLIAKKARRGRKSIGYAGSKDRASVSVQLASIYGVTPQDLGAIRIRDISINGAWRSDGVEMGSNLGNSFTIFVRNATDAENAGPIIDELNGRMPNYFDRQRFGSRLNNAKIGMRILNNDFKGAVMELLTACSESESAEVVEARERIGREQDFKKALDYFPRFLKTERTIIDYLAAYDNYANSIRRLPRGLSIMFIHAVESLVFNMALEERIEKGDFSSGACCDADFYGFPKADTASGTGAFPLASLVGYESGSIDDYEKGAMDRLGLAAESFRIRGMPELSMKGSLRPLIVPFKDASFEEKEGDVRLDFSLPSGSYATILVSELTKSDGLDLKALY